MNYSHDQAKLLSDITNLRSWGQRGGKAPHKYLLLISIIDILDTNHDHDNCFTFSELEPVFLNQARRYGWENAKPLLEYPFFHLASDGFWHLRIKEGQEDKFETYKAVAKRLTKSRLLETVEYGYLDPEVFEMLSQENIRNAVRANMEKIIRKSTHNFDLDWGTISLYEHEKLSVDDISKEVQRYQLGHCLNNVMLYDETTGQYLECDLIVIGYSGIYLVELKHWTCEVSITFKASTHNWVRNGKYIRNPHILNDYKAKILKGIYQHKFITYPEIYVESVVILTNEQCKVEGASSPNTSKRCPSFYLTSNFIKYLKNQLSAKGKLLSAEQVKAIRDYLISIHKPEPGVRLLIPNYEIIEHLSQTSDLIEVVAKPISGHKKSAYRFRRYLPPTKADPEEKSRFLKRAYNTLNAVEEIGVHPNILRVWPVPDDTEAVTEGSDWSEEGTLRDLIYEAGGKGLEEGRALELCRGILSGLHAAHAKGVIHRAVKPENILMINGVPKLMNFDLSYQLVSDSSVTVIPDTTVLKSDPYTAPEVYALQDVDDSTDLFSVGVILFELLCGAAPFKTSRDLSKFGGRLPNEKLSMLADKGISRPLINFIDRVVRQERSERIRSTEEALQALGSSRTELQKTKSLQVPNRILDPGETHDVYKIKRLIGEGTEAQVYEAATTNDRRVALKVFHKDIPLFRIQQEEINAGSVKSSYLAHAKRLGHWKNDRYYIEMSYLDGHLMREDILHGRRPDEDTFVQVSSCLLEALQALHERTIEDVRMPLIHGDIKPDNIMLRHDGTAVLFDFGCSGPPRVDTYQGTEGYVAPDLVQGADLQFCESGDLFALGVSLFEWAFGKRPYDALYVGAQPQFPVEDKPDLPEPLIRWLRKSVQTTSEERFENVGSMAEALFAAVAECKGQAIGAPQESTQEEAEPSAEPCLAADATKGSGNPFVAYLNSLHNASECNVNALAEAQALSSYFGYIHVPQQVTTFIYDQLSSLESPHIILTGHAGDGKSTVALELFKRARSIPPEKPLSQPLQEREEFAVGENTVVLVKDMSELGNTKTMELLEKAIDSINKRYLIVSNTGALLNGLKSLCERRGKDWLSLQNKILSALEEGRPSKVELEETSFLIINLARMDNVSTACEVFQRMLTPELWEDCEACGCREACPIRFNVLMLQENLDVVRERIEIVYRRLFEYGVRLTLRQLTGHLAYAITGGLSYEEIGQSASKIPSPPLRRFLFFNRFFGDSGELPDTRADQLEAVRRIRTLEPGRSTHMGLERLLWSEEESPLPAQIEGRVSEVFSFLRKVGSKRSSHDELPVWAARMQVRRIIYLFGRFSNNEDERGYITTFLRSPMLWDFHRWQKTNGQLSALERRKLERAILHVLQEHFTGVRLPENNNNLKDIYITLNRRNQEIRQSAQIVLAKYPADNFEFSLTPFCTSIVNTRYESVIRERVSGIELKLDLPFLDYVKNRFGGEIAQKLQSFFVDRLERFKVLLLKNQHRQLGEKMLLVRLQLDQSFKSVELSVADGKLEVL